MDALIEAMTNEDLEAMRDKHPSVADQVDGILATRHVEAVEAQAKVNFTKGIDKLFAELTPPNDVYNIYARWGGVDIPGEEEEYHWTVKVNHVCKVGSSSAKSAPKRAITVLKHNQTGADELIGNFTAATETCRHLGIPYSPGGETATRILIKEGYYFKPYDGTDYIC